MTLKRPTFIRIGAQKKTRLKLQTACMGNNLYDTEIENIRLLFNFTDYFPIVYQGIVRVSQKKLYKDR